MIVKWVLTIWLAGNPVPLIDPVLYSTLEGVDGCRAEGIRQVQDYQAGGVRASYECEPKDIPLDQIESLPNYGTGL